jgi:phosphocarrier protein FPr
LSLRVTFVEVNDGVLIVRAPLSGVVWPLERIPDPVFAQKMVGDGASIGPIDAVLVAPCDGDVLSLHPAAMR